MKKILIVGILILTIVLGAFAVYADTGNTENIFPFRGHGHRYGENRGIGFGPGCGFTEEERQGFLEDREIFFQERENLSQEEIEEWFKERTEYKRQGIEEALSNGIITEEEARILEEELQAREEYHRENGFNSQYHQGPRHGREIKGGRRGCGAGMGRGPRF